MGTYMDKPDKTKRSQVGRCENVQVVCSVMQGWRSYMEDTLIANSDLPDGVKLFGVFDGHGGG
jgi:serine/threonine protein phosphatase PrpC